MDDFSMLYDKHFSGIYNYMFYRVLNKEIAEDLTSDCFLKIAENMTSYNDKKSSFSTWAYKIAHNVLIDYFRKKKVNISVDDEENDLATAFSVDFEGEAKLIQDEERRELYLALTKLDQRTRELLSLKYFMKFNNREIAEQTGINESTVSTICLRGIEKIKKHMS